MQPGNVKAAGFAKARGNKFSPLSATAFPDLEDHSSTHTEDVASDYAADHANGVSDVDSPASGSVASASTTSLNGTRRRRPQAA